MRNKFNRVFMMFLSLAQFDNFYHHQSWFLLIMLLPIRDIGHLGAHSSNYRSYSELPPGPQSSTHFPLCVIQF